MGNPIIQKDLLTDLGEYGYNLEFEFDRISLLADITGTPITSVVTDLPRLMEELEEWIKYG